MNYWPTLSAARERIDSLETQLRSARDELQRARAELDIQRRRADLMEGNARSAWQFAISGPSRPPATPRNPSVRVETPDWTFPVCAAGHGYFRRKEKS